MSGSPAIKQVSGFLRRPQGLSGTASCSGQVAVARWTTGTGRQHPVPAGSISKTFIATGVLMLRDAGRLSLSDPIGKYLDEGVARRLAR